MLPTQTRSSLTWETRTVPFGRMCSLVKPGGYVALRDIGGDHVIIGDGSDAVRRTVELMHATVEATNTGPYGSRLGSVMHRMCRLAGLEVVAVTATWDVNLPAKMPESMRSSGGPLAGPLGRRAVQLGLATDQEIQDIITRTKTAWSQDPDGLIAVPWFEVVARKP